MNKNYKWNLTKSVFRLFFVSASAILGLAVLGLKELTVYYKFEGFFSYTEIPNIVWNSLVNSFNVNYGPWMLINLIPIVLSGVLLVICLLCAIFNLKASNLISLVLIAIGCAPVLFVSTICFHLLTNQAIYEQIVSFALFKDLQANPYSAILGVAIWWTALSILGMIPSLIMFVRDSFVESFNKKPKLSKEAKFYYDRFDKAELSNICATGSASAPKNSDDYFYGTVIGKDNKQISPVIQQAPAVQTIRLPRKKKVTINNIRVNKGPNVPTTDKANVAQFVNCDETFINGVRQNAKDKKGVTI